MKLNQLVILSVVCIATFFLSRTSAESKLESIRQKLYDVTKELEAELEGMEIEDDSGWYEDNDDFSKRNYKTFIKNNGLSFGKRGAYSQEDNTRAIRDQSNAKNPRGISRHSALTFGKRGADWEGVLVPGYDLQYEEPTRKRKYRLTGHTAMILGKRDVDQENE